MDKVKVGIIGAGGYGGCGAVELLFNHPHAEISALIDLQDTGKPMSDLYPFQNNFLELNHDEDILLVQISNYFP